MYEDLFNFFNNQSNTQTDTEEETEVKSEPVSYSSPASENEDYSDDYSVKPNYQSETNYSSTRQTESSPASETQRTYRSINAPIIQKTEEVETVSLIKQKEVIRLTGRMKIVLSMFVVIVAALLVAIVWNFASASSLRKTFADKELQISSLQTSISQLTDEYNMLGDDEYIREQATGSRYHFVEANDSNTVNVTLDEMHVKKQTPEVPSNWFNDVCDFLSKIFG